MISDYWESVTNDCESLRKWVKVNMKESRIVLLQVCGLRIWPSIVEEVDQLFIEERSTCMNDKRI